MDIVEMENCAAEKEEYEFDADREASDNKLLDEIEEDLEYIFRPNSSQLQVGCSAIIKVRCLLLFRSILT